MKSHRRSDTALLIARAILLAEATPALRPLVIEGSAALARRLLGLAEPARGMELALRYRAGRAFLWALERCLLPGIVLHWLVRKRRLDELAREALQAGCKQVVVLGAGLDGLAWRLREEAVCFELDHPATQEIKRAAGLEGIMLATLDLGRESPATVLTEEQGFFRARPTLFLAEGLLMYLPPQRVVDLFKELAALGAAGSRFVFTFMEAREEQPIAFRQGSVWINRWLKWRGEPFSWSLERSAVAGFAAGAGWRLDSLSSAEELRSRLLVPHALGDEPLAAGESIVATTLFKNG